MRGAQAGRGLMIAAFVFALAYSVLCCIRGIWAVDFWWQLATGRYIVSHGIPHADVFSYPSLGNPWYELRWLYCLEIYGLVHALGYWAVVVAKALVIFATFALALSTEMRQRQWHVGLAVCLLALFASSLRFFERPELWSYFFLALFVWAIQRWRTFGGRLIWLLPVLQVVWTNTHTLFPIGPGLVGCALVTGLLDRSRRSESPYLVIVLLLTTAACLANPYGLKGALFPLELLSEVHGTIFKSNIQELRGPFAYGISNPETAVFAVLIALSAAALCYRRLRTDMFLLLASVAMLYLSLTAIRNVPLFCIACVPLIVSSLADARWLEGEWVRNGVAIGVIGCCSFLIWTIATGRWIVIRNDVGNVSFGLAPDRYPVEVVRIMQARHIRAPVYCTMVEGSYLVWAGYKSFIDPRLEVAGELHFDESQKMQRDKVLFSKLTNRYKFRSALVDLESPVNDGLLGSKGWHLVYFDAVAALYSVDKADAKTFSTPKRAAELFALMGLPRRFADREAYYLPVTPSAPYAKVAQFLFRTGERKWAQKFAARALDIFGGTRGAHAVLGKICFEKRGYAAAVPHLRRALREAPNDELLRTELAEAVKRTQSTKP